MTKMDLTRPRLLCTTENPIKTGLEKWREEYNEGIVKKEEELMREIEKGVERLDKAREAEAAEVSFKLVF